MEHPALSTVPSTDLVFRRVVEWTIEEHAGSSPDELTEALRPVFPRVTVLARQSNGERPELFAYRDGPSPTSREERWWEAEGVAVHRISQETGRLTYVTREWAALMLSEVDSLLGRHFTDFVTPIMRPLARVLFRLLREHHEIETHAAVQRPDGTSIAIEIHATCGEEEVEVHVRPLI